LYDKKLSPHPDFIGELLLESNLSTTSWSPSPIREEISPLIGGDDRRPEEFEKHIIRF